MATLEYGADSDPKLLAAFETNPEPDTRASPSYTAGSVHRPAVRANRAVWPKDRFELNDGGGFVCEMGMIFGNSIVAHLRTLYPMPPAKRQKIVIRGFRMNFFYTHLGLCDQLWREG